MKVAHNYSPLAHNRNGIESGRNRSDSPGTVSTERKINKYPSPHSVLLVFASKIGFVTIEMSREMSRFEQSANGESRILNR